MTHQAPTPEPSDPPKAPTDGGRKPRRWPWRLGLGLTLAAILAGGLGILARDGIHQWLGREHRFGQWSWRLWGVRGQGISLLHLDSAWVRGPSLELRLEAVDLHLSWAPSPHPVPAEISVQARRLDILPLSRNPPDTSAPAFPDIDIPLALRARLDTIVVHGGTSLDSRTILAAIRGISLESRGSRHASLRVLAAESPTISAQALADMELDWTESDTLRARFSAIASSGCCASDTLAGEVSLWKRDLRLGRERIHGRIEESRGWSEVLPALAKAPSLHGIDLDVFSEASSKGRNLRAAAGLLADSISVLPPMKWNLHARFEGGSARVRLTGTLPGSRSPNLDADLLAPLSPRNIAAAEATGTIVVRGLGMSLAGAVRSFDSDIRVLSLDRRGAALDLTTAGGSLIHAAARWKGLHWNLDGEIARDEPWAVGWTDSLHLDGGGRAHGQDSAGGALFTVTARHPRIRMVRLDSLSTRLWISPDGPTLVFSGIEARDSSHAWTGSGRIVVPDSTVHFELSPSLDSTAQARLDVKFDGSVRIAARNFPSLGLPLRLQGLPAFPLRIDAEFRREPPTPGKPAVSLVQASARGMPSRDSLHVALEMAIGDSSLRIGSLRADIGGSAAEGRLALALSDGGWILDTMRVATDRFDLSKLEGVAPGIPRLYGRVGGYILSERGTGVSADLRVEAPGIAKPDGDILLPDFRLWGERDTLNLGGWWPLAGARAPFRLTATHLWDPSPEFSLLAFWGDVLRVRANGAFENKRHLRTDIVVDGSTIIPGTEMRLLDLLVQGSFDGDLGEHGLAWKAKAEGQDGILQALAGNPMAVRFHATADPEAIHLLDADIGDAESGTLQARGRYDLRNKEFSLDGHAHMLHFDLGSGRRIDLDSLVVAATTNSRIDMALQGASWHQAWSREERLDVRIPKASLTYTQSKDWRKLSGDVAVDDLYFSRNFANVGSLWKSLWHLFSPQHKSSEEVSSSSSTSTLLDLRLSSMGDSIRIADNLGQARLGFDLQVVGPAGAPLLNGFLAADTEGGHFGYLKRDFHIDTLRVDWNTQPIAQGRFQLSGFRNIRKNCQETSTLISTSADSCKLSISAQGSLENPRLRSLTSDCASQQDDDGTVGATMAMATGCYSQQTGNSRLGSAIQSASTDIAVDLGKDWFNEYLSSHLRDSRGGMAWLPDSVALTDLPNPTSTTRDQFGVMALYHITPEMDAAGIYQHTFAQSATTTSSKAVLSDNYELSLQYHIPFHWIDDSVVRHRLENRVFLQCDIGQALDENDQKSMLVQPSLRYRWEFW